jgi:hypothetical protein
VLASGDFNVKIKALITTLILGSSSVALAETQVRDHRHHNTVTTTVIAPTPVAPVATVTAPAPIVTARLDAFLDARLGFRRAPRPMPVQLTYVTLADNLALDGRALIKLQPTSRQFTKLEFRAEGNGRTMIDKVVVVFGNGRSQTIKLDAKLGKKQPTLAIDLKGETRTIERVIVVGKSNGRNAAVDVLAI